VKITALLLLFSLSGVFLQAKAAQPVCACCACEGPLGKDAEAGQLQAQVALSFCYLSDHGPTACGPQPAKAVFWLGRAAQGGSSEAQYRMGWAHIRGTGVAIDLPRAVRYWESAAQNGFAPAQYDLAEAYALGVGVPTDSKLSERWYLQAEKSAYATYRKAHSTLPEFRKPCENEIEKFCSNTGRAEECLKQKRLSLSTRCKVSLFDQALEHP